MSHVPETASEGYYTMCRGLNLLLTRWESAMKNDLHAATAAKESKIVLDTETSSMPYIKMRPSSPLTGAARSGRREITIQQEYSLTASRSCAPQTNTTETLSIYVSPQCQRAPTPLLPFSFNQPETLLSNQWGISLKIM